MPSSAWRRAAWWRRSPTSDRSRDGEAARGGLPPARPGGARLAEVRWPPMRARLFAAMAAGLLLFSLPLGAVDERALLAGYTSREASWGRVYFRPRPGEVPDAAALRVAGALAAVERRLGRRRERAFSAVLLPPGP